MSKSKTTKYLTDTVIDSPVAVIVMSVLAMIMGVIFLFSNGSNRPIPPEDAVSYAGSFDYYDDSWKNYRQIHFEDGSVYDVYAHTETAEFFEKMKSLEKGTKLYLLINPNNECVAEIRTETEELLNFQTSQQEIYDYGWWYVGIGIFACGCGVFLLIYGILSVNHKRKEKARQAEKKNKISAMRRADTSVKSKTLLEAKVQGYHICYRRVKSTNELVVNGWVYDEMTAVVEFEHRLCARVDGHNIEAGCDSESFSYILMDGQTVARKKRWF